MRAVAYVLIRVEAGKARKVMEELQKMEEVLHVDAVTGPFDLIVSMGGADFTAIAKKVIDEIHKIDGVKETITCNVISFEQ